MFDARLGVGALLMREHDDGAAAETAEPADDRAIFGESAIARKRREFRDQAGDVIAAMRPFGMARELDLLPRRELGIGLPQQPIDLVLEPLDLIGNIEIAAIGEMAKLFNLAFELGERLLEFEKMSHHPIELA